MASDSLETLSPDVEQCYYRIAQEALENIARHAGASRFSLRITQEGEVLTMCISDDGIGFASSHKTVDEKFGLVGMRERAALIGATLAVESQPGQGATLCLRLGGDG